MTGLFYYASICDVNDKDILVDPVFCQVAQDIQTSMSRVSNIEKHEETIQFISKQMRYVQEYLDSQSFQNALQLRLQNEPETETNVHANPQQIVKQTFPKVRILVDVLSLYLIRKPYNYDASADPNLKSWPWIKFMHNTRIKYPYIFSEPSQAAGWSDIKMHISGFFKPEKLFVVPKFQSMFTRQD